jgi:hypothetical protein
VIRAAFKQLKVSRRGHEFENADASCAREQAEGDMRIPDWDLAPRITTARGALKRGLPADIVRKAYGERIYLAAIEDADRANDTGYSTAR